MEKIALFGGNPVKTTPFGTGKRFGDEELMQLKEALEQQTLFYWHGKKVKAFCEKLAGMYGVKYCVAATSGTAAIHVALGTLGVSEGDEVIVPPITDMGTVIGALYQNAIPIFADLDVGTYNLDPKSVEEKISDKTKAIIVAHLAGNPADMDAIMAIAKRHNVYVVEDCAQSWLSCYKGRLAGTIGDIGCFSTNDYKHISTGDGGALLIKDDESLYRKALRFADKNYERIGGEAHATRNCESLAPNYRMTELQGAVGIAQLDKLEAICKRRNVIGDKITKGISGLNGVCPPKIQEGCKSSYWFYMMQIDEKEAGVSPSEFAQALGAEGIPASHGYIPTCVYEYPLFVEKNAYPGTSAPFDSKYYGRQIEYKKGLCPLAERILERTVKFSISEFYTDQDIDDIISAICKVAAYYAK
ncbi:MAG: DegT/DnrJ/EryC1/StrS family aminotransferase [Oscillospiraceae bacterium]|nr:DegT/DnrJ/EryC1/StrS family aminotransferase [Oscillospiraceae bacterium]